MQTNSIVFDAQYGRCANRKYIVKFLVYFLFLFFNKLYFVFNKANKQNTKTKTQKRNTVDNRHFWQFASCVVHNCLQSLLQGEDQRTPCKQGMLYTSFIKYWRSKSWTKHLSTIDFLKVRFVLLSGPIRRSSRVFVALIISRLVGKSTRNIATQSPTEWDASPSQG